MIASAIADSSSSWCRSAIRWLAPTYFTVARPAGVSSTRRTPGGSISDRPWICALVHEAGSAFLEAGFAKIPPGPTDTGACETRP